MNNQMPIRSPEEAENEIIFKESTSGSQNIHAVGLKNKAHLGFAHAVGNTVIQQLLTWRPAFKNLFEVTFTNAHFFNVNPLLQCSAISFPGANLNFTRHSATKYFVLDTYTHSDEVTITWREDSKLNVRMFHEKWFSLFYDRQSNIYWSGNAEQRALDAIVAYQSYNNENKLETVKELWLIGLLPTAIPELDLSWASSDTIEYTLTYKVREWKWMDKIINEER